jgi:hypothetical protein
MANRTTTFTDVPALTILKACKISLKYIENLRIQERREVAKEYRLHTHKWWIFGPKTYIESVDEAYARLEKEGNEGVLPLGHPWPWASTAHFDSYNRLLELASLAQTSINNSPDSPSAAQVYLSADDNALLTRFNPNHDASESSEDIKIPVDVVQQLLLEGKIQKSYNTNLEDDDSSSSSSSTN